MSFGGVIKLQGEKEYRRALQQIRQSLRETGSSLAAITSSFKTSSKSMDDSKASATKLNEVLKKQTSDHEKLKSAYEKMQVIYDKNNKSIDELTKRYKDAKAKLESLDETVDKTSEEYKGQVKVLQILEQSLENETQKQKANEIALSRMRVELNNSQTAMDKTAKELDQLEKSMSESEEAAKKANSAYGILKSTIEQQENELKSLKNEYKNVILEQGKESDSAKKLSSKIQDLSKNLKDNKTKLKDTEKAADDLETSMKDLAASTKKPIDGFKTFETALGNVIATVVQKAIDKLKELIKQTIDVGAKFDTAMSKVSAISGAKGDELLKLREKAKEMGASTKYTASEAAEAFNYMAMAGWTTEEMLEGISGVLNLAASSGTDLAETTDIVTDAMTAMGYSAGDAGHFADVLAAASANANTNVLKMGQTFQYAAPVLGALKYNIEDAALAIGLMADSGIKADKAGTALRSILTRLAAPPKDCANAMMELGISLTDAQGNMRPLKDVINDLRTSFSGLTEEEKASFAKAIAGKEAMSGLLSIVNTSKAKYDQLTGAISNCDGAADNMANTMLDNVEGGFTRLKSNFESTQIAIYEKFEPALRKATEFLNNLVGALQFVIDHSAEFEAALGGIAAGVATYLAVFKGASIIKGFATAIGTVTTAIDLLTIAISLNPLGAALVAVAALTTGFIILWNKSEKFRKFWIDLGENIKKVTKDIVDSISKWFVKAWEKVTEVWGKMSGWFSEKWESVKKVFGKVKDKYFFRLGEIFW